jgi:hypothetical protein
VKATHNARCITCQGNIRKGEEVEVIGGWWRHQICTARMVAVSPPATVVPKVTANALTHAVWALAHSNDRAKAQELVGSMGPSERQAYLALLTELINMMWSET